MSPRPPSGVLRPLRRALATACALSMLASPAFATSDFDAGFADETGTSHPAVDLLVLRPIGFVVFVAGVHLMVPAAFLTLITRPHEIRKPFEVLVVGPARYVWVDPLGEH